MSIETEGHADRMLAAFDALEPEHVTRRAGGLDSNTARHTGSAEPSAGSA
jgi:hypothetical protein